MNKEELQKKNHLGTISRKHTRVFGWVGIKTILPARNLTCILMQLQFTNIRRSAYGSSTSSVKHYSEKYSKRPPFACLIIEAQRKKCTFGYVCTAETQARQTSVQSDNCCSSVEAPAYLLCTECPPKIQIKLS